MANILVTGGAGFIRYHLIQALLKQGDQIVGIDNLNHYYDPQLKLDRLKVLGYDGDQVRTLAAGQHSVLSIQYLRFQWLELADRSCIELLFKDHQFDIVSELLMTRKFNEFLEEVGQHYDLVIIDTPPALAVTDAAVVGKQVGATMMIIRFRENNPRKLNARRSNWRVLEYQ